MGLFGKITGRLTPSDAARREQPQPKKGLWIDVSGKAVHLDDELVTGAQIKKAAGIDSARILTIQSESGPQAIKDDDRILVRPDDYFEDLPNWVYS